MTYRPSMSVLRGVLIPALDPDPESDCLGGDAIALKCAGGDDWGGDGGDVLVLGGVGGND